MLFRRKVGFRLYSGWEEGSVPRRAKMPRLMPSVTQHHTAHQRISIINHQFVWVHDHMWDFYNTVLTTFTRDVWGARVHSLRYMRVVES